MDVTLMHREVPVLTASYDRTTHSFTKILATSNLEHAPVATFDGQGLVTLRGLNGWWTNRAIPRTRDHVTQLAQSLSLSDTTELLEASHGLSLSDTYWVRGASEDVSWSQVNYYENDFDTELGLYTLGESSAWNSPRPKANPSSSTGGDLQKAWVIGEDGKRLLLKAGRGLAAQEVFNELCATRLYGHVMPQNDFVSYSIIQRTGRLYSACPDMLDGSADLVSAWDLVCHRKRRGNQSTYEWCVSALEQACPTQEVEYKLCRMLACDFVLGNFDRHYNNFGVLRDAETLGFMGLAPIYDSGNSLWCNKMVLDTPADYAYEALPFAYRGMDDRTIPDPSKQLGMLGDWRWYEPDMFGDVPEIVFETLSEDENLTPRRIEKVVAQVRRNVSTIGSGARNHDWQGTCTERMRRAGKRIDPPPYQASE